MKKNSFHFDEFYLDGTPINLFLSYRKFSEVLLIPRGWAAAGISLVTSNTILSLHFPSFAPFYPVDFLSLKKNSNEFISQKKNMSKFVYSTNHPSI